MVMDTGQSHPDVLAEHPIPDVVLCCYKNLDLMEGFLVDFEV